jgi:N-methylhydantoinase A
MSRIAGIDVGGTFTDLILVDDATATVRLAKVPTTVENQAWGVLAALDAAGADPASLDAIVHGTTTTTNAMLERKIAKVGLITTRGFRDVLELGRRTRPTPYGLTGRFVPLIPRELRFEVDERMDAEGQVLVPLDEAGVATATRALIAAGAESVVIHFLHSYINAAHEARAAEIVRALWPNPHVTAGHTVVAEYREYERGTTCCGQRRDPAGAAPLHRAPACRARGPRLHARAAGDAGQRRDGLVVDRRRARGRDRDVGPGVRRDRGRRSPRCRPAAWRASSRTS